MPLILFNKSTKGRFIKYIVNGGAVKSVWVDAFKTYVALDVDSTDSLVSKVDRSRLQKIDERSNQKTLSSYLYKRDVQIRDITNTETWKKRIISLISNKFSHVFKQNGNRLIFALDSKVAGTGDTIYDPNKFIKIGNEFNGEYTLNGEAVTINKGILTIVVDSTSFTWVNSSDRDTIIHINSDDRLIVGTEVFSNKNLSSPLAEGDYTYNGSVYTIDRDSLISTIAAPDTYVWLNGSSDNINVYVASGEPLIVRTKVYENVTLSTTLRDDTYTYKGSSYVMLKGEISEIN